MLPHLFCTQHYISNDAIISYSHIKKEGRHRDDQPSNFKNLIP